MLQTSFTNLLVLEIRKKILFYFLIEGFVYLFYGIDRLSLDMKEPIFEYDFPPPYIKRQTWFPLKEPFNLYMDKYRDPKQVHKEYLLKKLKKAHPFKEPEPPLRYPNAQVIDDSVPSWLKLEIRKNRMGWGRINDV